MPFIVIHEDNCLIATEGPTHAVHVSTSSYKNVATPCSCGGMKVNVSFGLTDVAPVMLGRPQRFEKE